MKQPKKPTYEQKQRIAKAGLDPKQYGVVKDDGEILTVINRVTNEIKEILLY